MSLLAFVAPDVEALVIAAMAGDAEVAAALTGGVHGKVPDVPTAPFSVVMSAGGAAGPAEPAWLVRARIQVDTYGDVHDREAASVADLVVNAFMHQHLPGSHARGVVTRVRDETVHQWLPDPRTKRPRYISIYAVHLHP